MSGSALSKVRRPEYTGDRRCWPCTVVNVALLAAAAVAVAVAGFPYVAAGGAVLGLGVVWLRGYLVPGTPAFAPRVVTAVPGGEALFGKSPSVPEGPGDSLGDRADAADASDPEALLGVLVERGVIEPEGEHLALDSDFEAGWFERMEALSALSTDDLAAEVRGVSAAADARAIRDDDTGEEWVALSDGGSVVEETWLSRPVAVAETAAARELETAVEDPATRRAAAGSLRMFLETCPDCGTPLEEASAVSCCGGYEGEGVPEETLVCPACRVRLFTFD